MLHSFSSARHLFLVSACSLLLSSCVVQHNITQTVDKAGVVSISIVYDFSVLKDYEKEIKDMTSSSSATLKLSDLRCSTLLERMKETFKHMKSVKCAEKSAYVFEVSGKSRVEPLDWMTKTSETKTTYSMNVRSLVTINETSAKRDAILRELAKEISGGAITKDVSAYYLTIAMPGSIVSSPVGTIRNGKLYLTGKEFKKSAKGFVVSDVAKTGLGSSRR